MKIVKAVFVGKDGSCGYNKNREYRITISQESKGTIIVQANGDKYVEYESIIAFLNNWDNVRVLD